MKQIIFFIILLCILIISGCDKEQSEDIPKKFQQKHIVQMKEQLQKAQLGDIIVTKSGLFVIFLNTEFTTDTLATATGCRIKFMFDLSKIIIDYDVFAPQIKFIISVNDSSWCATIKNIIIE